MSSHGEARERASRQLGGAALRLYALSEVQEVLGVSRWQIYRLLNSQQLRSVKIGRRRLVPEADLRRFIDSLRATEASS